MKSILLGLEKMSTNEINRQLNNIDEKRKIMFQRMTLSNIDLISELMEYENYEK